MGRFWDRKGLCAGRWLRAARVVALTALMVGATAIWGAGSPWAAGTDEALGALGASVVDRSGEPGGSEVEVAFGQGGGGDEVSAVTPAAEAGDAGAAAVSSSAYGGAGPSREGAVAPWALSLQEAVALAMENNVRVRQAAEDKGAAYVAAEQARIARAQALDALEGKPAGQAPSYYVSLYTTEEQKAEAKKIADRAFEVVKEQVKLIVEKAYFDVLKNRELVRVNEAALERAKHQLELARAGFTAGTAPKTDVLAAEAGVASAEAQLTKARNDAATAMLTLNKEIGLPLETQLELTEKVEYQPPPQVDLQAVIAEVYGKRLDMAQAESNLKVARKNVEVLADYVPGTFTFRLAQVDVQKAEINLENTRNQVALDLTQAYLNVVAADKVLQSLKAGLEQARESHRLASLRYEVGVGTSLEVLQASEQLLRIESQYVEALFNYNLALLTLETAKVAPVSGLSTGSSTSGSSSTSTR